ncbi:ATP-binding cassette domain-containing protein, partial [bacterium]|nr:ATP-binding cassette domain-containing protein [bacterium]
MSKDVLLEVKGLQTYFNSEAGVAKAVNGVDYKVYKGEVLGIVGESGSGKSTVANAIINLIDKPGKITNGSIKLDNIECCNNE